MLKLKGSLYWETFESPYNVNVDCNLKKFISLPHFQNLLEHRRVSIATVVNSSGLRVILILVMELEGSSVFKL